MTSKNLPKLSGYLPKQDSETYPTPGQCIYCGDKSNLSDEHIIPFALGGNFVLKDSSCKKCAEPTSKFELTCLRTMYGPLRLLYELPTRRRKKSPEKLPLKVKFNPDEKHWQLVLVDQKRFPFLVTFPYFEAPGIFSGDPIHQSGDQLRADFG
jgi:HNH endonuclease